MTMLRSIFTRFRKDESGATLVEYGIALFVAILVAGAFLDDLAEATVENYGDACTAATAASTNTTTCAP